jgi:tRNA-dihydrouridine synthase
MYVSNLNQDVPAAEAGEFSPLNIGSLQIWPPVVLAPMAGVTNSPFRRLCREFGAGLYISEMVTAMLLVRDNPQTLKIATFAQHEKPRSLQLYGVDPYYVGEAVKKLVAENRVDHIDMNFGCPVRKVTSKGGGAAIPIKPNLLRNIVRAAVKNAADVPVTIKFRIGINERDQSQVYAGKIG